MALIRTIDNILARLEQAAIILLFGCLIGAIVINILARNLLHISAETLFELTPMMVLWLSLLGASLAMRSERHIKLELIMRFCPQWFKRFAFGLSSLFGMVVMVILWVASVSFFKEELAFFGPKGWFSLISPIFFASMTLRYGVRFLSSFKLPAEKRPIDPFP